MGILKLVTCSTTSLVIEPVLECQQCYIGDTNIPLSMTGPPVVLQGEQGETGNGAVYSASTTECFTQFTH